MNKRINLLFIAAIIVCLFFGAIIYVVCLPMFVSKCVKTITKHNTACQVAVFKLYEYKKQHNDFPADLNICISNLPDGFPFEYHVNSKRDEFCLMFNEKLFNDKRKFELYRWLSFGYDYPYPEGFFSKRKENKTYNIIFNEVVTDKDVLFIGFNGDIYLKTDALYNSKRDYYENWAKSINEKLPKSNVFTKAEFYFFDSGFSNYSEVMEMVK
jgi:hypothetical protein